jgi:hypothetical protein
MRHAVLVIAGLLCIGFLVWALRAESGRKAVVEELATANRGAARVAEELDTVRRDRDLAIQDATDLRETNTRLEKQVATLRAEPEDESNTAGPVSHNDMLSTLSPEAAEQFKKLREQMAEAFGREDDADVSIPEAMEDHMAAMSARKVERDYAPFFAQLDLAPDVEEQILALLIDREHAEIWSRTSVDWVNVDFEAMQQEEEAAEQAFQDSVAALLKEDQWAAWEEFEENKLENAIIRGIDNELREFAPSLDEDARAMVIQVLVEEEDAVRDLSFEANRNPFETNFEEDTRATMERAHARLATELNKTQLRQFERYMKVEIQQAADMERQIGIFSQPGAAEEIMSNMPYSGPGVE